MKNIMSTLLFLLMMLVISLADVTVKRDEFISNCLSFLDATNSNYPKHSISPDRNWVLRSQPYGGFMGEDLSQTDSVRIACQNCRP